MTERPNSDPASNIERDTGESSTWQLIAQHRALLAGRHFPEQRTQSHTRRADLLNCLEQLERLRREISAGGRLLLPSEPIRHSTTDDACATTFQGKQAPKAPSNDHPAAGTDDMPAFVEPCNDGSSVPRESPLEARDLPRTLGRFEILQSLGQGGQGKVLKAWDPLLNRFVALKVPWLPFAHTDNYKRFVRELRSLARLSHPNIVPVYEVASEGPVTFMVSEYVAGTNLAKWLAHHKGPVDWRTAVQFMTIIADAVAYLHRSGIVHRDLKPANILLHLPDDGLNRSAESVNDLLAYTPKLCDFGLIREMGKSFTQTHTGTILGTPSYMAPEQTDERIGEVGPAADVYALGVILCELLTATPPSRSAAKLAGLQQVTKHSLRSLRASRNPIPRRLELLCSKCLAPEPRERYHCASPLLEALRRLVADGTSDSARVKWFGRSRHLFGRNRFALGIAIFSAVALGITLIVLILLPASNPTAADKMETQPQPHSSHDTTAPVVLGTEPAVTWNPSIAYWRFEDGWPGSLVHVTKSEYNSPTLDARDWEFHAGVDQHAAFGSDVPATHILDPLTGERLPNRGSLKCTGDGEQVIVDAIADLRFSAFTLELFLQMDAEIWASPVVARSDVGWWLAYNPTAARFSVTFFPDEAEDTNNISLHSPVGQISAGTWHHLALTFARRDRVWHIRFYVNYKQVDECVLASEYWRDIPLRLGVGETGQGVFHIDEVRYTATELGPDGFLRAVRAGGTAAM